MPLNPHNSLGELGCPTLQIDIETETKSPYLPRGLLSGWIWNWNPIIGINIQDPPTPIIFILISLSIFFFSVGLILQQDRGVVGSCGWGGRVGRNFRSSRVILWFVCLTCFVQIHRQPPMWKMFKLLYFWTKGTKSPSVFVIVTSYFCL